MRYEQELQLEILGEMIKTVRLERNLTQEELGKLMGVQRAQISKLENNTTNVTVETILKVFGALNAKVNFNVELMKTPSGFNLAFARTGCISFWFRSFRLDRVQWHGFHVSRIVPLPTFC